MDLETLQEEVKDWADKNFGENLDKSYRQLLGAGEELGKLFHAHLKGEQGIRHTPEEIRALKIDAIGDILIYLADYCNKEGILFQRALDVTWAKVQQRDWKKRDIYERKS